MKLGSVPVGIAPGLADRILKYPNIQCEEPQTEKPEPEQRLHRRQRRRHSDHSHHKLDVDHPRVEGCPSWRTSRQNPINVSSRNGVTYRHRRSHQGEQDWSLNRYRSRWGHRHQSGSSQTKKSSTSFRCRLWELYNLVIGECIRK
jgi:hypothetical protein